MAAEPPGYVKNAERELHRLARVFVMAQANSPGSFPEDVPDASEAQRQLLRAARLFAEADQAYGNDCAEAPWLNGRCQELRDPAGPKDKAWNRCMAPLYAYPSKVAGVEPGVETAVFGTPDHGVVVCGRLPCAAYDIARQPPPGVVLRFAPKLAGAL